MDLSPAKFLKNLAKWNLSTTEAIILKNYQNEEDIDCFREDLHKIADDFKECMENK